MVNSTFYRNVFVNCPLDRDYDPILQAILFCLVRFGLTPRIATERHDASETRINKILDLISSSRYSIHDLSRCQASDTGEYYRLNMPFELGIDLGCRHYGGNRFSKKIILILGEQPYVHQAAISDMAGVDVMTHGGEYGTAVRKVRNWLTELDDFEYVGPVGIVAEYEDFQEWYYKRQLRAGFSDDDIQDYSTVELLKAMFEWNELGRPRGMTPNRGHKKSLTR